MDVQSTFRSEIVSTAAGLEALEPAWWELWRQCPPATPFQSPAWLIPWWQAFSPGDLAAVAVWRGERLVALAPFYLERTEAGVRLLPVGISLSDYLDVLIEPASQREAGDAIVTAMLGLEWDNWDFEELRPEAQAWGLLDALSKTSSEPSEPAPQSACPVLALNGPADLSGCVPSRRRQLLRTARAAATRQGCDTALMGAEESHDFLVHFFKLHALRWTERGEEGLLADARVRRFHRAALPRLAAAGLARCFVLRIAGKVAGAYHGLLHGSGAYYYLGGFDPSFARESPGAILIRHAISDAVRQGASEFHFLRGREPYKYSWGAVDRWNRRCRFPKPPTP